MSLIYTSPEQKAKDLARMEFYNVEAAGLNKPHVPITHAVKANGFVFIQGQVGVDPVTLQAAPGIRQQTLHALQRIEMMLHAAGSRKSLVVKCNCYITDIRLWDEMNAAYAEFFEDHRPARTCVQVIGFAKHGQIEIECVALHD